MLKKILIITLTILIAVSGFLTGFFSVGVISVYAAVDDDSVYVPLRDPSDAVIAFQAYCKSRDLTIEGSLTDAVTTFTTGAFNSACNEIGINISELQAELKAEYDQSSKPVKFLLNDTGVMAMNRIFAQFLQDNELEVGDEVEDKLVYSGKYFVDADGNGCLVYIYSSTTQIGSYAADQVGSPYRYTSQELSNLVGESSYSTVYHLTSTQSFSDTYTYSTDNYGYSIKSRKGSNIRSYSRRDVSNGYVINDIYGDPAIIYINEYDKYYIGCYVTNDFYRSSTDTTTTSYLAHSWEEITRNTVSPVNANIFITTNNLTINNNEYEGDTIINNEGDIINNNPDNPDDPDLPQPTDPNNTIHNVPQNPLGPDGIDLPDIDIPNLPIGNLSEKFPFSIPWDLAAFYAFLDAEPQAPRFNGTMDLSIVQWNYDIDLSSFDSAAALCRKLQFGLFLVGLIVASRNLIRG